MRSSSTRKAHSTRFRSRKIGRNPDPLRCVPIRARQIAPPHQRGPQPPVGTDCAVGKRRQSQHNTARHHPASDKRSTLRIVPRSPELSCCDRKSAVLRSPRPIAPVSYLWAPFSMSSRPTPPRTSTARRTTSAQGRRACSGAWSAAAAVAAAGEKSVGRSRLGPRAGEKPRGPARRAAVAGGNRASQARVCTLAHFGDTVRPPRRIAVLPPFLIRSAHLTQLTQLTVGGGRRGRTLDLPARIRLGFPLPTSPRPCVRADRRRRSSPNPNVPRPAGAAPRTHRLGMDSNTPQSTR